jgi:tetratricopeptide (TPR) repeat protein
MPAVRVQYRARDWDGSYESFQRLLDVAPENPAIWAYVGRCYGRRGQLGEAEEAFEWAIELARAKRPIWWLYHDWGQILARYGRYPQATDCLARAKYKGMSDPSILGRRRVCCLAIRLR